MNGISGERLHFSFTTIMGVGLVLLGVIWNTQADEVKEIRKLVEANAATISQVITVQAVLTERQATNDKIVKDAAADVRSNRDTLIRIEAKLEDG